MVELKSEIADGVPVSEIRDGDIAIILEWAGASCHYGKIVQRYKDSLITLGEASGEGWSNGFKKWEDRKDLLVRILPKGTELVID